MTTYPPDTEELLRRTGAGDPSARQQLLARHRDRLRRMVAVRLDPRLAARVDPSDVVQEAMVDAARKLDGYLRDRPLPFYPWLRRLAWERLVKMHQRHVGAGRRSVTREEPPELPEGSALELAERLLTVDTGPEDAALKAELRQRVRTALERLAATDREVLVLRYLEELSVAEIAAVLDLGESAVYARHLRALKRLKAILGPDFQEDE